MQRNRISGLGAMVLSVALVLAACSSGPQQSETAADDASSANAAADSHSSEFEGLMVHAQRAREAAGSEDWGTALTEYRIALEREPDHPILLFRVARFEAKLGQENAAIAHLEKAAQVGATGDTDSDEFFDSLRERDDFQAVAKRLAENGRPHAPAEVVITFQDAELWPEGIATDAATGDIYVGSFGRSKVVRISPTGEVEDFGSTAGDDLQAVVGIWVDSERRELWAATGDQANPESPPVAGEVVRYSIDSGRLAARYPGPDDGKPQLINDVTVGPDGTAYVTESLGGRIFRVPPDGDALELFKSFPRLAFINGVAISEDGSTLYFAHIEGLSAIDLASGDSVRVTAADGSVLGMGDGLSWAGDGLVIVQNQPQLNFRVVHAALDEMGRRVTDLSILPSGLPDGLIPYTSAVLDQTAYIVAAAEFGLMGEGEVPPAPVVFKIPV